MVVAIILILMGFLLVYLLFAPLVLHIDTTDNQYYIKMQGLVKASFLKDEKELLKVRLNILFMNFYFYPLRKVKVFDVKRERKNVKKSKKTFRFKTGIRLLKSFKIKKFLIDIDTGDCITNAKLYPIFALLNYKFGGFHINFDGKNRLVLDVYNRPIEMIKTFINT